MGFVQEKYSISLKLWDYWLHYYLTSKFTYRPSQPNMSVIQIYICFTHLPTSAMALCGTIIVKCTIWGPMFYGNCSSYVCLLSPISICLLNSETPWIMKYEISLLHPFTYSYFQKYSNSSTTKVFFLCAQNWQSISFSLKAKRCLYKNV